MPKLLVNSFQTRSSLQIKHGNFRTDKDVRPQNIVTTSQPHQIIVSSINWLLGFFHTLASLASTTWLHGNFEWQWHLLNPYPVAKRQFYHSYSSTTKNFATGTCSPKECSEDCLYPSEKDQLDDYLPCRQLERAKKTHDLTAKSNTLQFKFLISSPSNTPKVV
ncbi:hypothetical protein OnM2_059077 [Erysiphe neolycopersici]|uniref:Uncharacterized protein n=1 Tax=Erysiphe neolycopersici TaxID=212602 RepID=A0A420HQB5_9PEZI|nr:hypothetical protein OnM2_059077 [Erysiphe neolycopersici]